MKNTIFTIIGIVFLILVIFMVPVGVNCAFECIHKQEMYTALEVLDEYNFDNDTEIAFRDLIDKVAKDSSYNIFIERLIDGVKVKIIRTGEYSTEYYEYFYE